MKMEKVKVKVTDILEYSQLSNLNCIEITEDELKKVSNWFEKNKDIVKVNKSRVKNIFDEGLIKILDKSSGNEVIYFNVNKKDEIKFEIYSVENFKVTLMYSMC